MDSLKINVNNLKKGIRYKILTKDNNVFSGIFDKSVRTRDNKNTSVIFTNALNETDPNNITNLGNLTVIDKYIKSYYIPIFKHKGVDVSREITEYGGKVKTRKSKVKTRKSKVKTRKSVSKRNKKNKYILYK
jgi:hypothetical protein